MSESRAKAVRDARELAASAAQKAAEASATFDRTLASARAEVYGQMDEARRTAMARRAAVMAETKQETERDLHAATTRLADQAAAARTSLERDAAALAGDIVGRVLGRTA